MDKSFSSGSLLFRLEERIEANDAAEFEKEITNAAEYRDPRLIVLDAEKLGHISGEGLRAILTLKKKFGNLQIINVPPEILNIFNVMGLTKVITVEKPFRQISIASCSEIGSSEVSTAFMSDNDAIIKLFKSSVPFEIMAKERENAAKAQSCGVPTVIPENAVQCGSKYGLEYKVTETRSLGLELSFRAAKGSEYANRTVELLKLLNETQAPKDEFPSYKEIMRENVEALNSIMTDEELFGAEEIAALNKLFNAIPDRDTVIHGDFHPRSIFIQNEELMIIDVADMGVGHPIFEFVSMYKEMHTVGELSSVNVSNFLNLIVKQYFGGFNREDIMGMYRVLNVLSHIKLPREILLGLKDSVPEKQKKYLLNLKGDLHDAFFKNPEEIINLTSRLTSKF